MPYLQVQNFSPLLSIKLLQCKNLALVICRPTARSFFLGCGVQFLDLALWVRARAPDSGGRAGRAGGHADRAMWRAACSPSAHVLASTTGIRHECQGGSPCSVERAATGRAGPCVFGKRATILRASRLALRLGLGLGCRLLFRRLGPGRALAR